MFFGFEQKTFAKIHINRHEPIKRHGTYFELFVDSSWVCPDVNKQSVNELGGILLAGVNGPYFRTLLVQVFVRFLWNPDSFNDD